MSWNGVKKQSNIENIKSWCEDMGIKNYTVNSKGEIDVNGFVLLNNKDFEELPYKFGYVNNTFSLRGCKNLISLRNCPNIVDAYFSCSNCTKLDSLEGCPKKVGVDFYCGDCKRRFTKEEVRSLCEVINNIYI